MVGAKPTAPGAKVFREATKNLGRAAPWCVPAPASLQGLARAVRAPAPRMLHRQVEGLSRGVEAEVEAGFEELAMSSHCD
mmetsp:Transcript_54972/g.113558  ORF Transcript_54972/g.113558 Transcript_54972/m.113558 type:complete len:80 (+) Transcript_54972:58-297(+)